MAAFRWVLLSLGIVALALLFAYSRGLFPTRETFSRLFKRRSAEEEQAADKEAAAQVRVEPVFPSPMPATPRLKEESKVVAVRILPEEGSSFPAEELILALRAAGLKHGHSGIFHCPTEGSPDQTRFSVASLVEPGSFDLSHLKESSYPGISVFTVLPAHEAEDEVQLFDDMVASARAIAHDIEGRLADEQGGALSLQRERYMREEVIQYVHRRNSARESDPDDHQDLSATG